MSILYIRCIYVTYVDVLKELHVVLCKFKLEDLKDYAFIDFPETTWSLVCALIQRSSEDLKPKTVADAIIYLMKKNLTDKQDLEDRIETLRLRGKTPLSTIYE